MKGIIKDFTKISITAATIVMLFSTCRKENVDPTSIIGRWVLVNHNIVSNGQLGYNFNYQQGYSYVYHFRSDKTCTLYNPDNTINAHGSYRLDSNNISIHLFIEHSNLESLGISNWLISNTTLTFFSSGHDVAGEYTESFIYNRLSY